VIWSAKEAALKALRLGLTVDTRSLSCAPGRPNQFDHGWALFEISCNPALLGRQVGRLHGWWQRHGGYVLTIALLQMERTA
jgi:4'-phosphopantetheinyl transferase